MKKGLRHPGDEEIIPPIEPQTDLMKKGLRHIIHPIFTLYSEPQTDLMKKGLRLRMPPGEDPPRKNHRLT